jgi:hypothetical protein
MVFSKFDVSLQFEVLDQIVQQSRIEPANFDLFNVTCTSEEHLFCTWDRTKDKGHHGWGNRAYHDECWL